MKLSPRNRYLLIEPIKKEKKEEIVSGVLLPDDYKPQEDSFVTAVVKETSPSCSITAVSKGDIILVERNMIQEMEINEYTFYLVLENYIYGVLSNR